MCLSVCLLVCFLSATCARHLSTVRPLPPSTPRAVKPSRAAPRTSGQAHACTARARARPCRTTSQRKNRCANAFQKQLVVRAHACCRICNCQDFQKKGKRKPTCHFPSSVYSLPSLGVFTFRIVLNRILHKSSLLAPMELLAGRDFVLDLWSEYI